MKDNFKRVKEGIYQCQLCGYSKASGEEQVHGAYHKSYLNCKQQYGADNLLDYADFVEKKTNLESKLLKLKEDRKSVSTVLEILYKVEYTTSIRLWDYSKPHPKFEDYVTLLWNTEAFLDKVSKYLTEDVYSELVRTHKSNRKISGGSLICHKVEATTYAELAGVKDISYVDNIVSCNAEIEMLVSNENENELDKLEYICADDIIDLSIGSNDFFSTLQSLFGKPQLN